MKIFKIPTTVEKLKPQHKTTIWHVIFLTPIFIALFGFGSWSLGQVLELKINGIEANAKVIEVSVSKNDEGQNQYKPTFEFHDKDKTKHQKTAGYSSSTRYAKEQIIAIIYLKENPTKTARIDNWMDLWLMPLMLLAISIFGEFGIVMGYKKRLSQTGNNSAQSITDAKDLSLLLTGAKVTSRYWQAVRENEQKYIEVQYVYENQSYKTRSQAVTEKQLNKLVPGEEITVRVNPRSPEKAIVQI